MSNIAQPDIFINYISEFKKIFVTRQNKPITQMFKIDSNITDDYYFQIINKNNQIVSLAGRSFQIYGSIIDAKSIMHVLFFTDSYTIEDNVLHFHINTFTSQYMAMITNTKEANITIVETTGNNTQVVLRDVGLFYKRPYIEGQQIQEINNRYILTGSVPFSGQFGSGQDINLTDYTNGSAFGTSLTQTGDNQMVIGYNNTPDATKAFIVANSGNIFTVDYEGNVEAKSISAETFYISGEAAATTGLVDSTSTALKNYVDNNYKTTADALNDFNTLNAKINNLSAADDGKFEATSAWANSTFETSANATAAYNALEQDISDLSTAVDSKFELKTDATDKFETLTGQTDYLSGQIDATNLVVNQVTNTLDAKANKNDLEALSGKVEAITVPTKVSELENDIPYLSSITSADIPTSYVQEDQLADYATVASLTSYAEKSEIPVLSSSISAFLAEGDNIKLTVNENTGVVTISGTAAGSGGEGKTYTGASGIVVDNDNDIIGISATNLVTTEQLGEELNAYTKTTDLADYISSNVITGYATTGWVEEQGFATTGALSAASGTLLTSINGLDDDVDYLSSVITGKANQTALDELSGATSGLPSRVETLETAGYITSDALNGYATTSDLQYVSGVVSAQAVDYTTVYAMLSSGDTDTLTITKDTANEKIVFTATGGSTGGVTPTQVSAIVGDMSGAIVDGYATQDWVTLTALNDYAQLSDIPTVADLSSNMYTAISGDVEDQITGKGYITGIEGNALLSDVTSAIEGISATISSDYAKKTDLPTELSGSATIDITDNVISLVDANTYAKISDIPTSTATSAEVSAIVEGYGYQNATQVGTAITTTVTSSYLTGLGMATTGEIPVVSDFISGIDINVGESTLEAQTSITFGSDFSLNEEEISINGLNFIENNSLATTTDLEAYELAEDVTTLCTALSTAITGKADSADIPTSNSGLTNDAHYISAITLSAYNASTMQFEGNATSTINLASTDFVTWNGEIFVNEIKYAKTTDIPTKVSQLQNDTGYITGYQAGTGIDINNGVISCTVQDGGGTTYTAGTGIDIQSNTISTKLSGGGSVTIGSSNGYATITAPNYTAGTGIHFQDVNNSKKISLGLLAGDGVDLYTGAGDGSYVGISAKLSAATSNVTIGSSNGYVTIGVTGGGGGGSYTAGTGIDINNGVISCTIENVSDLENDAGYITEITNKQRVYDTSGSVITYAVSSQCFEVFKTSYSAADVVISAVTVAEGALADGQVATFEEWVTLSNSFQSLSIDENSLTLIGELPSSISYETTHVFVRRIINDGGSINQYISYAYEF